MKPYIFRYFAISALAAAVLLFGSYAKAQLVVDYNFTSNTNVPDNGQYSDVRTLGGLSSFTSVISRINLSDATANTMWLGDIYSTLTFGNAGEGPRTAVLLNRPGVDNNNAFGSSLNSLNVTFDDSGSTNVWSTTSSTGTYRPDARSTVNPYAAGVAFSDTGTANMAALQGSSFASGKFTMLVADTAAGAAAKLNGWGMTLTGTAASSGNMSATATGTMSISDVDSSSTNNLGASVDTTQNGSGGTLNVTLAGTSTFSGGVTGSGGLTKSGAGTLILTGTGTYTGGTAVNNGTLLANNINVSGNSATGTGSVTVNNGGTLGGTGRIEASAGGTSITINGGGTITGATNGSIGALTLQAPNGVIFGGSSGNLSTYVVDLDASTSDKLAIVGDLNLSSAFDQISFQLSGSTGAASYQLLTYSGSLTGTFDSVLSLPTGYTLAYNPGEIDLVSVAIPEPGTWAGAALTLVTVLSSQRKRLLRKRGKITS